MSPQPPRPPLTRPRSPLTADGPRRAASDEASEAASSASAGGCCLLWLVLVTVAAILAPILPDRRPPTIPTSSCPNERSPSARRATSSAPTRTATTSSPASSGAAACRSIVGLGVLLDRHGRSAARSGWSPASCGDAPRRLLMAVVDIFLAFPALLLLIAIVAFLGKDLAEHRDRHLASCRSPPSPASRAPPRSRYSQREFVLAAEAAGASRKRILVREILPNVILPLLAFGLLVVGHRHRRRGQPRLPRAHRPEHDQLGRHDQRRPPRRSSIDGDRPPRAAPRPRCCSSPSCPSTSSATASGPPST